MAKKLIGHKIGKDGKFELKELGKTGTRDQRKSTTTLIPWTDGPKNRRQKVARALWG